MAWLPGTSTIVEPARLDIMRCAAGGIILSSVTTRYQLGFAFQAGSVTAPPSASAPHGVWASAMKAAVFASMSPANEAANFALSSAAGSAGPARPAGIGNESVDRLAFVGGEGGDVDEARDVRMIAGLSDRSPAIRMTDENDRAGLQVDNQPGRSDVAGKRKRGDLNNADVEAVLLENVVDARLAGAIHESTVNQYDIVDPVHWVSSPNLVGVRVTRATGQNPPKGDASAGHVWEIPSAEEAG
jgi:hypothetical protein